MIEWFRRVGSKLNPSEWVGKRQGAKFSNKAPVSREEAFRQILRDSLTAKDVRQWIAVSSLEDLDLGLEEKTLFGVLLQEKHEHFSLDQLVNFSLLALQKGAQPRLSEMPLLVQKVSEAGVSTMLPFAILLEAGADPNTVVGGRPWLDLAIGKYHPKLALALLERGASVCDDSGGLRHHLLIEAFACEKWRSNLKHRYYRAFSEEGVSIASMELKGSGEDQSLEEGFGELIRALIARGLDINYVNEAGGTVYAHASPVWQKFLASHGAKMQGRNSVGRDIAEVLIIEGEIEKLEVLLEQDRNALFNANANGSFAVSSWWELPAHRATKVLDFFKKKGLWSEILGAVDQNGRNFFTAGLARLIRNGLRAEEEKGVVATLDVMFARLETEVHSSVWVDPDQCGETINFWLANFKDQSLMKKYILPRREAMINAALAKVDKELEDEPYVRPSRPRI